MARILGDLGMRILLGALALSIAFHGTADAGSGGSDAMCKRLGPAAEFTEAGAVWWGNRERSFTPYMEFAKTDLGTTAVAAEFDPIYFDLDKADLRPQAVAVLNEVFAYLDTNPGTRIVIEGHCCDWASDAYNMALGQRRADAAKTYLVAQGIAGDRITTVSYGEREPAHNNDGPQRPLNRRAEIRLRLID